MIIIPDDPESFKPDLIDVDHRLPLMEMATDPELSMEFLSLEDSPLFWLEPMVKHVDTMERHTIEEIRKQEVTFKGLAEEFIRRIDHEMVMQENQVQHQKRMELSGR